MSIPIVLSASEEYAPYAYVVMLSALKNKKESTEYIFYLIVEKEYNKLLKEKFEKLGAEWNTPIIFKYVGDFFSKIDIPLAHLSYQTYFRLLIPELISEHDKIINLGADTLVMQDLSEFYNIDVENYYVAGVKAAGYILNRDEMPKRYEEYGLKDISHYFNADSVLWNLKKIREDNLQPVLIELIARNFISMDQDIMNIAFQKAIKNIPLKFNMMTPYKNWLNKQDAKYPQMVGVYGENEIVHAVDNPVVIHYANKIKPWDKPKTWLANHWWKYAKMAPFPFVWRKYFSIKRQKYLIVKFLGLKIKLFKLHK